MMVIARVLVIVIMNLDFHKCGFAWFVPCRIFIELHLSTDNGAYIVQHTLYKRKAEPGCIQANIYPCNSLLHHVWSVHQLHLALLTHLKHLTGEGCFLCHPCLQRATWCTSYTGPAERLPFWSLKENILSWFLP